MVSLTAISSKDKIQLAKGIVLTLHQRAHPYNRAGTQYSVQAASKDSGNEARGKYADLFYRKIPVTISLSPAGCLC